MSRDSAAVRILLVSRDIRTIEFLCLYMQKLALHDIIIDNQQAERPTLLGLAVEAQDGGRYIGHYILQSSWRSSASAKPKALSKAPRSVSAA